MVLGNEAEFIAKLPDKNTPLFAAERGCWPVPGWEPYYKQRFKHRFNYLNSGLYYCPAKWFIDTVEEFPVDFGDDDQKYFTGIHLFEDRGITLDSCFDVFQCYSFVEDSDYGYENNRLQNLHTLAQPVFIHFNGRTDMTKILNMIK